MIKVNLTVPPDQLGVVRSLNATVPAWPPYWPFVGVRARRAVRDGVVAVGVASASSHLIGWWLPRRRPAADHLPAYQALIQKPTSSSFPSAHAATAAAFTTAIARESPAAGLVVAPVAVAVAHSRLRTRAHWPSDVIAGSLWGSAVGVATQRLLRLRPSPTASRSPGLHR